MSRWTIQKPLNSALTHRQGNIPIIQQTVEILCSAKNDRLFKFDAFALAGDLKRFISVALRCSKAVHELVQKRFCPFLRLLVGNSPVT